MNETKKQSADHEASITVWDPVVRWGHWILVTAFVVAYVTEDELLTIHSWAGYFVTLVVVVRIIWGIVGTRHARFTDFVSPPAQVLSYLKDLLAFRAERHIGHSPAGGAMIVALLLVLAVTTGTGTALLAVEENAGPLAPWLGTASSQDARAGEDKDDGHKRKSGLAGDVLEEVHELIAHLAMLLVILHVAGVIWTSLVHRENLVRSMLTGRKRR